MDIVVYREDCEVNLGIQSSGGSLLRDKLTISESGFGKYIIVDQIHHVLYDLE